MFDRENIKAQILKIYKNKEFLTKDIYIKMYTDIYNFSTYGCIDIAAKDKTLSAYLNQDKFYNFTNQIINQITSLYKEEIMSHNFKLSHYCQVYKHYIICSKVVDNLYQYFNRVFITRSQESNIDTKSYFDNSLIYWKNNIAKGIFIQNKNLLLDIIREERENIDYQQDIQKRDILRNVITSLFDIDVSLQTYKEIFEDKLLKDSVDYYKNLNITNNNEKNINEYMERYNRIDDFEQNLFVISTRYETYKDLKDIYQQILIVDNMEYIVKNFKQSIIKQNFMLSKKIYEFLIDFDKENQMISVFCKLVEDDIISQINQLYQNRQQDKKIFNQFTEIFIDKYNYYFKIINNYLVIKIQTVKNSFHNTLNFTLNENTFEKHKKNITNHFLCQYLNQNIPKDQLDNIDILIKFLGLMKDKDVFEQFYIKYLTKRLLKYRDNYLDREFDVISKLKTVYVEEFISKVTRIINDINISIKLEDEYQENSDCKSQITIITFHNWNIKLEENYHKDITIPKSLDNITNSFNKFYNQKYNGRKLIWNHRHSYAEIHTNYLKKKYIILVSLPQYNIFSRFNYEDKLKFESFTKEELEHCQYLTKNKFLNIDLDNQVYRLNYNFKNKKMKIDIHNFTPKIIMEKKKIDDDKFIEEDRKLIIQSVLVRIMKTRKTLEHTKLIQECLGDIKRFSPDVSMIKKSIELLIEKDYFERQSNNRKVYNYVS